MSQNVLILGDSGVGKTNLVNRLLNKPFNPVFVPSEFTKIERVPDTNVSIYDYPGELTFHPIFPIGITKVIIVYDVTSRMSYKNVIEWQNKFEIWSKVWPNRQSPSVPCLIVGNKIDETPKISMGTTISAKTNENIDSIINFIIS